MDYESDSIFPQDKTGRDASVRNMFSQGKVIDRKCDDTGVSVRVQFLDKQGMITKFIPVKQFGSRSTSAYWCPKVGDDVTVTMLPNSNSGDGFVDGSFYNTGNPPPITDADTRHITFADGTVIEYSEGNSTFTFKSNGPLNINCSTATVTCSGQCTIKAATIILDAADVKVTGKLWVDNIRPYQTGETVATPHVKNADGSGGGS